MCSFKKDLVAESNAAFTWTQADGTGKTNGQTERQDRKTKHIICCNGDVILFTKNEIKDIEYNFCVFYLIQLL